MVLELAESYAPAVQEAGRTLHWKIEPGAAVNGDRELIAQAVTNLLENAQSHTPIGTNIDVTVTNLSDSVRITVADSGAGVAPDDLPMIAQRFVRLATSRTSSGHGLGLNLVSAVARLHRGALNFFDNAPGLLAEITLPPGEPHRPL